MEDRACARGREHGRAEAGRDDAAHRAPLLRRACARPSCRRASSTSSPATAAPAPRSSSAERRQDRVHRARPRSARRSSAQLAGTGKKLTLELGGKAANIIFDDAALDQAVEGIVNGIYFNQGHVCCAGSRLLVQESIYEPLIDEARSAAWRRCASATRSTRTPTSARSTRRRSSSKIEELVAAGEEEGAEIYQPPCRLPEKGYWFAPTVFTNVAQSYRIAQEEIFGPVLSRARRSARRTRRSRRRTTRRTACPPASGRRRARASSGWRSGCAPGVVWANTYNRFDPASPFGGYKESGFGREGGRHGLEPYLRFDDVSSACPVDGRRTSCTSAARSRAPSRGRTYEAEGQNVAARPPREGRARRRARAARGAFAEAGRVLTARTTAARCSTGSPRCSSRGAPSSRSSAPGAEEVERSIDRLVWYAGWADKLAQVLGSVESRSRARTSTSRCPEPTGVVGDPRADEPPLLGTRLARRARDRRRQRGSRRRVRDAPARRGRAGRGARDARTFPAASSTCLTGYREELAPWLAAHMDVNALDLAGADGAGRRSSSGSRPTTSSASSAARRTIRARGRSPPSSS